MRHEVRSIPPAPRRVRMRPLLAHRWPLLAVGGASSVLGCLFAWLMFLQAGGKPRDQQLLREGPVVTVPGTIGPMEHARVRWDGHDWQRVNYTFDWHGGTLKGECFVPAGRQTTEDRVEVEVLPGRLEINCIVGGLISMDRTWLQPRFWLGVMVVPGALLLLGWAASFFQLRQVLVHGDVSVGRITAIRPVPVVLPEMLCVAYEFRDHRAVARRNRHWVRLHGELGARLARQMQSTRFEEMPVLHDRRLPQWNRMLLPQDFLPQTSEQVMPANGTS
ncbi:MAG TPA: hypothetical protein VFZ65_16675 [Planctomycetota bacterium]|nr:hypothetical protein [Planctomycetota bacterium]